MATKNTPKSTKKSKSIPAAPKARHNAGELQEELVQLVSAVKHSPSFNDVAAFIQEHDANLPEGSKALGWVLEAVDGDVTLARSVTIRGAAKVFHAVTERIALEARLAVVLADEDVTVLNGWVADTLGNPGDLSASKARWDLKKALEVAERLLQDEKDVHNVVIALNWANSYAYEQGFGGAVTGWVSDELFRFLGLEDEALGKELHYPGQRKTAATASKIFFERVVSQISAGPGQDNADWADEVKTAVEPLGLAGVIDRATQAIATAKARKAAREAKAAEEASVSNASGDTPAS